PDPRERSPLDLDQDHRAVRHRHRPLGETQSGRELGELRREGRHPPRYERLRRRDVTKSTRTYSPSLWGAVKKARPRLMRAISSTKRVSQGLRSSMKVLMVMCSRVQRCTSLSVSSTVRWVGG